MQIKSGSHDPDPDLFLVNTGPAEDRTGDRWITNLNELNW
jgi:hypothetical protein